MKRKIKNKRNTKNLEGLTRLASFTSKSISSAYENFKKKQELNKIKEIKLKK